MSAASAARRAEPTASVIVLEAGQAGAFYFLEKTDLDPAGLLAAALLPSLQPIFLASPALNALILAIVGTLQKLSGSTGIYFGAIAVPQIRFFSTFVYHNHWGAFVVMMLVLPCICCCARITLPPRAAPMLW